MRRLLGVTLGLIIVGLILWMIFHRVSTPLFDADAEFERAAQLAGPVESYGPLLQPTEVSRAVIDDTREVKFATQTARLAFYQRAETPNISSGRFVVTLEVIELRPVQIRVRDRTTGLHCVAVVSQSNLPPDSLLWCGRENTPAWDALKIPEFASISWQSGEPMPGITEEGWMEDSVPRTLAPAAPLAPGRSAIPVPPASSVPIVIPNSSPARP